MKNVAAALALLRIAGQRQKTGRRRKRDTICIRMDTNTHIHSLMHSLRHLSE